jgi:hypothetical protein
MIFDRSDQDQFGICFGCCTDPEPIEFGPGLRPNSDLSWYLL